MNADSFPNGYDAKYQTQTAGASVGARAPTWACAIRAAPGLGPARTQRSDLSSLSCTAPLSDSSWFSSKLATTSSPPIPFLPFRPPLVLLTSQIEILLPPSPPRVPLPPPSEHHSGSGVSLEAVPSRRPRLPCRRTSQFLVRPLSCRSAHRLR